MAGRKGKSRGEARRLELIPGRAVLRILQSWRFGRGHFGRFAAGRRRRRSHFVRIDFALADEGDSFLDRQLGGANVAEQFRLGLDVDLVLGDDVAGDLATHDHRAGIDGALDRRVVAQVESPLRVNIPFQFPVEGQFSGKFESPLKFNVRVEDVLRIAVVVVRYVHDLVRANAFAFGSKLVSHGPVGESMLLWGTRKFLGRTGQIDMRPLSSSLFVLVLLSLKCFPVFLALASFSVSKFFCLFCEVFL